MRLFSTPTLVLILLCGCIAVEESRAQPSDGPAYSRQRSNPYGRGNWNGSGFSYGSTYARYYGGHGYYPYQQAYAGSWYTRPYPHHFDYYRQRSSAPPQSADCPCAQAPAEY